MVGVAGGLVRPEPSFAGLPTAAPGENRCAIIIETGGFENVVNFPSNDL